MGASQGVEQAVIAYFPDRAVARHLALALIRHRKACARNHQPYPSALAELERAASEAAGVPGRLGADGGNRPESDGNSGQTGPSVLSQRQVAAVLGIHPRTVRRMLDRGELQPVYIGSRRRVARESLQFVVPDLGPDTS